MDFLNSFGFWALAGAGGIAVPVVVHLLNRRTTRTVEWGAMRFLRESITRRSRRLRLEEALLLACRCLLLAALALALARPFARSAGAGGILLLLLAAVAATGVAVALWAAPRWRIGLLTTASLCVLAAGLWWWAAARGNLGAESDGPVDLALVIDLSQSTQLEVEGRSNFDRVRETARTLVRRAPRDSAFAVVGAGALPEIAAPPSADRAAALNKIDGLTPTDGPMAMPAAITRAVKLLEEGRHAGRHVVVLSDGQSRGWAADRPADWTGLAQAVDASATPPATHVLNAAMPGELANLAVADIRPARTGVLAGQEVEIEIVLRNPGTLAVTPGSLQVIVDGTAVAAPMPRTLAPAAQETLRVPHRFDGVGAHVVEARVAVGDDLTADNELARVLVVREPLRALLVEPRPALGGMEGWQRLRGLGAGATGDGPVRGEVVAAAELGSVRLEEFSAVLLCEVPRLPEASAVALARYAVGGGGLWIALGPDADEGFFNGWVMGQSPVLPARLIEVERPRTGVDAHTGRLRGASGRRRGRRAVSGRVAAGGGRPQRRALRQWRDRVGAASVRARGGGAVGQQSASAA